MKRARDSCSCCIAERISDWPVASSLQNTRTSAGVMSALHTTRLSCDANRRALSLSRRFDSRRNH